MTPILVDTDVLSCLSKRRCLAGFLRVYPARLKTTGLVKVELDRGVARHRDLQKALDAIDRGDIALYELTDEEKLLLILIKEACRGQRIMLSDTDCSLVAAAVNQEWLLLSHDGNEMIAAAYRDVTILRIEDALTECVDAGCLTGKERQYALSYWR